MDQSELINHLSWCDGKLIEMKYVLGEGVGASTQRIIKAVPLSEDDCISGDWEESDWRVSDVIMLDGVIHNGFPGGFTMTAARVHEVKTLPDRLVIYGHNRDGFVRVLELREVDEEPED